MNKLRRLSGLLVTFAFVLTFVHAAIPHHHHGDIVCFSVRCHNDCVCEHHDDGEHDCTCSFGHCQHHHPLHNEDNCILTMPFIVDLDHHDLSSQLAIDYATHYLANNFTIPNEWVLASPMETSESFYFCCDDALPNSPTRESYALRGPPLS